MKYAAVLFDMDGTLIETSALWEACIDSALRQRNIPFSDKELMRLRHSPVRDLLLEKGYGDDDISKVKALRDAAMTDHLEKIFWMPGAEKLLSLIKAPKALITSTSLNMFKVFDNALKISSHFSHIVTSDDVRPDYKPHPKGLLIACEMLKVQPSQCVYIGDQTVDMEAAKSAGMDFILVRGIHTPAYVHHFNEVNALNDITMLLQ